MNLNGKKNMVMMMSEKQVIVTLEDGFGRVQTKINTSLSAPQLMDKIMEIDEQQDTLSQLNECNDKLKSRVDFLEDMLKELQRSREYWIQDNNRLTKRYNELIAKIDYLERVIEGDINE